jgi:uncharacterized protein YdcH (DUF465 family)
MGIKKSDITEFISAMILKRKQEISEPAKAVIEEIVTPIIMEKYRFFAQAEREAERLYDSLDKIRAEHSYLDTWDMKHLCSYLTSTVISFRKQKVNNYTRYLFDNLFQNTTNGLPEELHRAEQGLKTMLSKEISKYRKIVKLSDELHTLIESCRNGDTAYKRLTELKINMSGFEAASKSLPAVIRLSEDVCILNGDCEQVG